MAYIGNKVNGGLADGNAVVSGTLDVSNDVTLSADVTIDTNTLIVDSSNNKVGIGGTPTAGSFHIFGTSTTDQVIIENTNTGGSSAPDLVLFRKSTSSAADGDVLGRIDFRGLNDANEEINYATIFSTLADASDGTENGKLTIQQRVGSSYVESFTLDENGNVGIGTSSIDVSTQAGGSGYRVLQIENDEGGQINLDHNDAGTGSTLGQINFQRAGEVLAEIEGVTDGATDNGKINFRTQPDGGALAVRATIDHDGNFGIGTDDPAQKLDIQSSSTLSTRILATGNNTRAQLLTQAHTSGGSDVNMVLGSFGDSTRGEISMNTNHPLRLYTNNDPDKGVELETDGDLNIKDGNLVIGTSGHGISFAATSDASGMTSELLDDYEEGTWTPTVQASGGSSGQAYSQQVGNYTKIGNLVTIFFTVILTNEGTHSGTELKLFGLPFTVKNNSAPAGGSINFANNLGNDVMASMTLNGNGAGNTTTLFLNHGTADSTNPMANNETILANTSRFDGFACYLAA